MAKHFSVEDVIESLRAKIAYDYSQSDLARDLKCSRGYLSDVLAKKRPLTPDFARRAGYEMVFVKITKDTRP